MKNKSYKLVLIMKVICSIFLFLVVTSTSFSQDLGNSEQDTATNNMISYLENGDIDSALASCSLKNKNRKRLQKIINNISYYVDSDAEFKIEISSNSHFNIYTCNYESDSKNYRISFYYSKNEGSSKILKIEDSKKIIRSNKKPFSPPPQGN